MEMKKTNTVAEGKSMKMVHTAIALITNVCVGSAEASPVPAHDWPPHAVEGEENQDDTVF